MSYRLNSKRAVPTKNQFQLKCEYSPQNTKSSIARTCTFLLHLSFGTSILIFVCTVGGEFNVYTVMGLVYILKHSLAPEVFKEVDSDILYLSTEVIHRAGEK